MTEQLIQRGVAAGFKQSYSYDDVANRLTKAVETQNGVQIWAQTYDHDAFGNHWASSSSGISTDSFTPTQRSNFVNSTTQKVTNRVWVSGTSYDLAGNQNTIGSYVHRYDGENRLVQSVLGMVKGTSIRRSIMDNEIEEWLQSAAVSTGFPLERVPRDCAAQIENRARQRFVTDNPRAWWMSLSGNCQHYDAKINRVSDILPTGGNRCWLIAETGCTDGLPVYSVQAHSVSALLDECPYFEYYIVAEDFSWLVTESDHNVLFVCRPQTAGTSYNLE